MGVKRTEHHYGYREPSFANAAATTVLVVAVLAAIAAVSSAHSIERHCDYDFYGRFVCWDARCTYIDKCYDFF